MALQPFPPLRQILKCFTSASQAANSSFLLALGIPLHQIRADLHLDKQVKQDSVKKTRIRYPMLALHNPVPNSCHCTRAMGKGRQQPTAGSLG